MARLGNQQGSVGKSARRFSMLPILAKLSRQAMCHPAWRLTLQLVDVLRDHSHALPSLPELSQLLHNAVRPRSQFMKHASEGKVALPQRFYPAMTKFRPRPSESGYLRNHPAIDASRRCSNWLRFWNLNRRFGGGVELA